MDSAHFCALQSKFNDHNRILLDVWPFSSTLFGGNEYPFLTPQVHLVHSLRKCLGAISSDDAQRPCSADFNLIFVVSGGWLQYISLVMHEASLPNIEVNSLDRCRDGSLVR